jgi:hypothetical protein
MQRRTTTCAPKIPKSDRGFVQAEAGISLLLFATTAREALVVLAARGLRGPLTLTPGVPVGSGAAGRRVPVPNLFGLTFAHRRDTRSKPPTNNWQQIKTLEEAERMARAARAAKDERAVAGEKRSWRKRQQERLSPRE